jgi:hypothetical protein
MDFNTTYPKKSMPTFAKRLFFDFFLENKYEFVTKRLFITD